MFVFVFVCVFEYVTMSHFQIDHYDATFISSQYLFFSDFLFFVVNVKLSHSRNCSTHFPVILTVTATEHTAV